MKRTRSTKWIILGLATVMVMAFAGTAVAMGRGKAATTTPPAAAAGASLGTGVCIAVAPDVTAAPLSQAEKDALLFMREEEKLARDVYQALYDKWDSRVFQNIAASEARHMASILTLIDRYGLEDPASAEAGVFTNSELQAAYNDLVAKGMISLADAMEVGVAIEKLDIEDLEAHIAESTHTDITAVYQNLLNGSENHLSAFERQIG